MKVFDITITTTTHYYISSLDLGHFIEKNYPDRNKCPWLYTEKEVINFFNEAYDDFPPDEICEETNFDNEGSAELTSVKIRETLPKWRPRN